MFYDLYWVFIKKNWKLYIIYFIVLMSIPLENTAIPHFYGEIINYLRKGDFKKSKYFFIILNIVLWLICLSTFLLTAG